MSDELGAVIDSPSVEVAETSLPEASTPAAKPETAKPEQPVKEEKQDKRRYPDSFRKTLKALKDIKDGPLAEYAPHAVGIHRAVGESFGYREVFPEGVNEARAFKAQIDAVGGLEKIAEYQQSYQHVQELDAKLASGDITALDEVFEIAGEGLPKLLPAMLDRIAESKPAEYQKMVAPHAFKFLQSNHFPEEVDILADAFNKDDKEGMRKSISRIVNWYLDGQKGAKPEAEVKDPKLVEYEKKIAEYEQKETQGAISKAYQADASAGGEAIDQALKVYQAKLNLGKEALELLREDVWKEIQKRRNADESYSRPITSIWDNAKKKFTADPVPYFKLGIDKHAKAAADHVVNLRYGHSLKAQQVNPVNPTAPIKKSPTIAPPRPTPAQNGMRKTFEQVIAEKIPQLRG